MEAEIKNNLRSFVRQINAVHDRIGADNVAYWLQGVACPVHGAPALDLDLRHAELSVRGLCCEHWLDMVNAKMALLPHREGS